MMKRKKTEHKKKHHGEHQKQRLVYLGYVKRQDSFMKNLLKEWHLEQEEEEDQNQHG